MRGPILGCRWHSAIIVGNQLYVFSDSILHVLHFQENLLCGIYSAGKGRSEITCVIWNFEHIPVKDTFHSTRLASQLFPLEFNHVELLCIFTCRGMWLVSFTDIVSCNMKPLTDKISHQQVLQRWTSISPQITQVVYHLSSLITVIVYNFYRYDFLLLYRRRCLQSASWNTRVIFHIS